MRPWRNNELALLTFPFKRKWVEGKFGLFGPRGTKKPQETIMDILQKRVALNSNVGLAQSRYLGKTPIERMNILANTTVDRALTAVLGLRGEGTGAKTWSQACRLLVELQTHVDASCLLRKWRELPQICFS